MTIGTVLRFQFGQVDAIQSIARNRNAIYVGLLLVLLTGIARNYDQLYMVDNTFSLIGPLVFSFFSGSFLFLILYYLFIERRFADRKAVNSISQWRSFMTLFWMTAPIAWLYAIPVERFLPSYHAAQANIALLAIVALWRVLLMARVFAVLQAVPFLRALGWVLIPASVEVWVVTLFGGATAQSILRSMSGMRNSPEEDLVLDAVEVAFMGAPVVFVLCVALVIIFRYRARISPLPVSTPGRIPLRALGIAALCWIAIAIAPQREQARFKIHARFVEDEQYRESLDYLARHSRGDFPPSRRLEPNPFESGAFHKLPKLVAELRSTDPVWVRRLYFDYLTALFSHHYLDSNPADLVKMFSAFPSLPEASSWIAQNRSELEKLKGKLTYKTDKLAETNLEDTLRKLGIEVDPEKN